MPKRAGVVGDTSWWHKCRGNIWRSTDDDDCEYCPMTFEDARKEEEKHAKKRAEKDKT